MAIKYYKLLDILNRKGMTRENLRLQIQISSATMTKISSNEPVSLAVIDKICEALQLQPGDILEYVNSDGKVPTTEQHSSAASDLKKRKVGRPRNDEEENSKSVDGSTRAETKVEAAIRKERKDLLQKFINGPFVTEEEIEAAKQNPPMEDEDMGTYSNRIYDILHPEQV